MFAGAAAGASVSIEALFGLKAEGGINVVAAVGASAELQQGFTLTAAGGVGAAIESVRIAKNEQAVGKTLSSFSNAVPALPAATVPQQSQQVQRPSLPPQDRTPVRTTGLPTPAVQQTASPAPPPPAADPRAVRLDLVCRCARPLAARRSSEQARYRAGFR